MTQLTQLYNAYFKAQDRFIAARSADFAAPNLEIKCVSMEGSEIERFDIEGFEVDIIHHYLNAGHMLASYFEPRARHENHLLCELTLRQIYCQLLTAIEDTNRSRLFRRICLNSVHIPLLALQRYYTYQHQGDGEFLKLKQRLLRIQTPFD